MNLIDEISRKVSIIIANLFSLEPELQQNIVTAINVEKDTLFGDLSCNAAMVLAKPLQRKPRDIAQEIAQALPKDEWLAQWIEKVETADPGFLNIFLTKATWQHVGGELLTQNETCFKKEDIKKQKYLIEFVSANPTGPLHLGHGRGAIIGDVLANVLAFLGHKTTKEYYINNTGSQIIKLGRSLRVRCNQQFGIADKIPEDAYVGKYLIDVAKECVAEHGNELIEKNDRFFEIYATQHLLEQIKQCLENYGVTFDEWFAESSLHENGSITNVIEILQGKKLVYEQDGALWFKSTEFGDDKDRVVRKQDNSLTYIAADIAYHKQKFDRGYDILIDVLGQDHHGYVKRLKGTMEALVYPANNLHIILYQLVSIKKGAEAVKMSKRTGAFTKLREIIDAVGSDVARFFYLNRKAEAHLDFDLDVALKKTEENPVYYIQYAYVRLGSILKKATLDNALTSFLAHTMSENEYVQTLSKIDNDEIVLLKKIMSLSSILTTINQTYHTHLLSYFVWELASLFHSYYAKHRILQADSIELIKSRLLLTRIVRNTIGFCLNLLGISKPEEM